MVTAISLAARLLLPGDPSPGIVAELGSLLLSRAVIRAPRWRAFASIQLVPALVRYDIPLDSLRADIRRDVAGAACPEPLRPVLDELLAAELALPSPRLAVLDRIHDALHRRDWTCATLSAAAAALRAGGPERVEPIATLVAERAIAHRVRELVRRGVVGRHGEHGSWGDLGVSERGSWGDFVPNVSQPGSESDYAVSLPLVIAVADAIVTSRVVDRLVDLERLVAQLPHRERSIGRAHVARALLAVDGERAASIRVRGIREQSIRAGAGLLLVRAALAGHAGGIAGRIEDIDHDLGVARRFAAAIETCVLRQRAELAIARRLFEIGQPLRARRALAKVTHASFAFEHWRLRSTIALQFGRVFAMTVPRSAIENAREPLAWIGERVVDPEIRARTLRGVALLRVSRVADGGCRIAADDLRGASTSRSARRELLEVVAQLGLDPFETLATVRLSSTDRQIDPLFAEWIGTRAAALVISELEPPAAFRDGVAGRAPTGEVEARRGVHNPRRSADDNADARLVAELLAVDASSSARALRIAAANKRADLISPIARATAIGATGDLIAPISTVIDEHPDHRVATAEAGASEHVDDLAQRRDSRGAADRASLERALYDEGVALSAGADRKRRAIIGAARACLRGAIDKPDKWPRDVLAARARTLAHLGGTLAKEAIEGALAMRPGTDVHVLALVEALCRIEPEAAARAALECAIRPRRELVESAASQAMRAMRMVELYGGLPVGFATVWKTAFDALRERLAGLLLREPARPGVTPAERARVWLAELMAIQGVPSVEMLEWIAKREELPASPRALLDEAAGETAEVLCAWPVDVARRIADDGVVLDTLLLLRRPKVESRVPRWGHVDWTRMLRRAASVRTGVIEPGTVARCARLLRRQAQLRWLMAGDLVSLGAVKTRDVIVRGERLRVRLLEKRGDLLAYLRFADVPVWNCYRSDSSLYDGTRDDTIAVWKDPLSYCFRVEREDGRPWGFVFGGFVEMGGDAIAAVLNGLYLRRQEIDARETVLGAIEEMLCRPLGIERIGVASQFGGEGPLPAAYSRSEAMGTRLRALAIDGKRVTGTYDDVSYSVNVPVRLDLWWRWLR